MLGRRIQLSINSSFKRLHLNETLSSITTKRIFKRFMKVQKTQRTQNHPFVTFFLANMKSYKSFNLGEERRFMVPMVIWSQGISGYYFHILFPIKADEGFCCCCWGGSDRKRESKTFSQLNLTTNPLFIYFHFNFTLKAS